MNVTQKPDVMDALSELELVILDELFADDCKCEAEQYCDSEISECWSVVPI